MTIHPSNGSPGCQRMTIRPGYGRGGRTHCQIPLSVLIGRVRNLDRTIERVKLNGPNSYPIPHIAKTTIFALRFLPHVGLSTCG